MQNLFNRPKFTFAQSKSECGSISDELVKRLKLKKSDITLDGQGATIPYSTSYNKYLFQNLTNYVKDVDIIADGNGTSMEITIINSDNLWKD